MPFKGFHGHTRHTHEDKVKQERQKHEEKIPPKNPEKKDDAAVKDEIELYNQPFEPFTPSQPAHYVNRFFRRSAQTVVHCVLALSPHFYIHTDELFDWMMPYERMGALLSEDAEDYINREKAKLELKKKEKRGEASGEEKEQLREADASSSSTSTSTSNSSSSSSSTSSSSTNHCNTEDREINQEPQKEEDGTKVSSIFSKNAHNPQTDNEVQVDPHNPKSAVPSKISHFHPPFLIIDCRRKDEYLESHIHGAYHIHYVTGKNKLHFTLPDWVEKDTPIITYCAVGLRSGLMVWELRRRGYRFVKELSGGYYKWVNEGRPIYANTGELTQKVLQQHKLAGIMLRKELKSREKRQKQQLQQQDQRVAMHHRNDNQWPQCHTYNDMPNMCPARRRSSFIRRQSSVAGPSSSSYGKRQSSVHSSMRRESAVVGSSSM